MKKPVKIASLVLINFVNLFWDDSQLKRNYYSKAAKYLSASSEAIQPVPAAVIA